MNPFLSSPMPWDGISSYFGWCFQERWTFCHPSLDVPNAVGDRCQLSTCGTRQDSRDRSSTTAVRQVNCELPLKSYAWELAELKRVYFLQAAQFPWAGTRCNEKSATWPTETDTKFQGLHLFIGLKCPVSIYCKWKQGIAAIVQKQWHRVGALALMYSSGSLRETLSSKGPQS